MKRIILKLSKAKNNTSNFKIALYASKSIISALKNKQVKANKKMRINLWGFQERLAKFIVTKKNNQYNPKDRKAIIEIIDKTITMIKEIN